jgi:hypothetical protein
MLQLGPNESILDRCNTWCMCLRCWSLEDNGNAHSSKSNGCAFPGKVRNKRGDVVGMGVYGSMTSHCLTGRMN